MNKLIQRLLTFFIGIPLVLFVVYIPFCKHIVLNILIVAVSLLSSIETYNIFSVKSPMQNKKVVILLSFLVSLSGLICTQIGIDFSLTTFVLVSTLMILMTMEIFTPGTSTSGSADIFSDANKKIPASLFVLIYGGYMLTFLSRISILENATPYLILFLFMVFICDSSAWLFGMTLGKNNRGYIKASPNKSIAGFAGGIAGAIASGILGWFIWRDVFTGSIIKIIVLGLIIGITSILGDLSESVFKRSAGCKDSGNIIPGRGGILDSVDSILMSAPVYYFLIMFMFE
ncbi:MAG: phosphatidate cytidylyltransferase [Spirochaetaceae bacterium]|nr:phosphatidate cytidylyltransferase [Spirochaetaceae bacterium]